MRVLYSSDTPGGRLFGVPVPPPSRDPGEKTEPGTIDGVGVAVPELGRDVLMLVVDSNSFDRLGFDRRYGSEASEDAGEARWRGSVIEACSKAYFGLGVASCGSCGGGICACAMRGAPAMW
jgi:hypothetical protein